MSNLDKAREWAESLAAGPATDRAHAAAKVIQSLPDQLVDAEKVRELADQLVEEAGDFASEGLAHRYMVIAKRLRDILPTPKLPTLADMTQEEREACQWMQAVRRDERCVITRVYDNTVMPTVRLLTSDGTTLWVNADEVTPLPGPKLQWPSSIAQGPTGASLDPQENIDASIEYIKKTASDQQLNTSETPKSSIKPEDVPDNEMWLVELRGSEWIGRRDREAAPDYPWRVTYLGGIGADIARDSQITLIHKLVPEPPALPEGMRLADHAVYGRVVTSPKPNRDGIYDLLVPKSKFETGADWEYAHECELTFLGGADNG